MLRQAIGISVLPNASIAILNFLLICFSPLDARSENWVVKQAEPTWTWFEDYYYLSANYFVACEPQRQCEVGTGIFSFGKPRGTVKMVTGQEEITVIGIGSIHIRSGDGKGPVRAGIVQRSAEVFTKTWPSMFDKTN
jgi:hypothetical protein